MRVLLTGATGLLGNNVLEVLLSAGHQVVALVRNPKGVKVDFSRYDGECNIAEGDVTDFETLRGAAQGCNAIINCAGDTDMSHRHREDYYPVNRDLCAALLRAAEAGNVTTLVHVSTANTIGYKGRNGLACEDEPMQPPFAKSYYAQSKLEGERLLLSSDSNVRVVIINPGFIIGRYDAKPSSGRLLLVGWKKRLLFIPRGGKSFVGARTVAEAAVAALSKGRGGERYLATGENLTFRQLYEIESSIGGYKQRVVAIPVALCKAAGMLGDLLHRCGLAVSFTSRNIDQLLVCESYCNRKMCDELGVKPQPVSDAVKDFIDYSM